MRLPPTVQLVLSALLLVLFGVLNWWNAHVISANHRFMEIAVDGGVYLSIGWLAIVYWRCVVQEGDRRESSYQALITAGVVLAGLMALVVPFHSTDLFGYINRGAQQVLFGLNPYLHPLADVPNWQQNPLFTPHWIHNPSPYGPFFNALAAGVVWVTGSQFWTAFLGFKGVSFVLFLVVCYWFYDLAKILVPDSITPEKRLVLLGLSPLVLLQSVANGHNDLWIPFGILGAWWLFLKPSWRWASLPILTFSILVKFTSLLALPFLLVGFIRLKDWCVLGAGSLVSVGITGLLGWLYCQEISQFPWGVMSENAGMAQHSLIAMVSRLIFYLGQWIPSLSGWFLPVRHGLKPVFWAVFVIVSVVVFIRFWRQNTTSKSEDHNHHLALAITVIRQQCLPVAFLLTLMITVISAKFHPWYVVMFLPLTLLLPSEHWLWRFGLYVALFQLLAFTPIRNIHIFNYIILTVVPFWLAVFSNSASRWLKWSAIKRSSN